jgi:hypothetical protein
MMPFGVNERMLVVQSAATPRAKPTLFRSTQHRALPSLRKRLAGVAAPCQLPAINLLRGLRINSDDRASLKVQGKARP